MDGFGVGEDIEHVIWGQGGEMSGMRAMRCVGDLFVDDGVWCGWYSGQTGGMRSNVQMGTRQANRHVGLRTEEELGIFNYVLKVYLLYLQMYK
jgi:hypothetical protein